MSGSITASLFLCPMKYFNLVVGRRKQVRVMNLKRKVGLRRRGRISGKSSRKLVFSAVKRKRGKYLFCESLFFSGPILNIYGLSNYSSLLLFTRLRHTEHDALGLVFCSSYEKYNPIPLFSALFILNNTISKFLSLLKQLLPYLGILS